MARRVRDADAEPEAAVRELVDIGGAVGKILDRAGIDRRDRGTEDDPVRAQSQRRALRHVAEDARHIEAAEAASLRLAGEIEGQAAASGNGDEAQGRQGFGQGGLAPLFFGCAAS